jgi:cellulose synthase/poly-beta-1,6-N-acetylglucosamine synthase-like glycosyltransferase
MKFASEPETVEQGAPSFASAVVETTVSRDWPSVSVLIPMRNEEAYIEKTLECVLNMDYPADQMEILVMDGMSTDRSAEIVLGVAARDSRVRLITNPGKTAPAAINLGAKESRNEILVRLDAHALFPEDYVRRSVEALLSCEDAGAAGGGWDFGSETPFQRAVGIALGGFPGVGGAVWRGSSDEQGFKTVDTVPFGAWPRSVFVELGGFNEDWVVNQDYEFNIRLRGAGYKVIYSPWIRSVYFPRKSLRALVRQYGRYGFWRAKTVLAYPKYLKLKYLAAPGLVAALVATLLLVRVSPIPFVVVLGAYALFVVLTALKMSKGSVMTAMRLVEICGAIHFAWGFGFWAGLLRWSLASGRREAVAT